MNGMDYHRGHREHRVERGNGRVGRENAESLPTRLHSTSVLSVFSVVIQEADRAIQRFIARHRVVAVRPHRQAGQLRPLDLLDELADFAGPTENVPLSQLLQAGDRGWANVLEDLDNDAWVNKSSLSRHIGQCLIQHFHQLRCDRSCAWTQCDKAGTTPLYSQRGSPMRLTNASATPLVSGA